MNKSVVGISLLLVCMLLVTALASAKPVVVPTYYGYGVVSARSGLLYPYIAGGSAPYYPPNYVVTDFPYNRVYNPYYSTGYYPYYGGYAGAITPYWSGAGWFYGSSGLGVSVAKLNLRSTPSLGGKSRNSNVVSALARGEQVYILSRYADWFLVQSVAFPQKRGYAYGTYIQWAGNSWYAPYYGTYPYMTAYLPYFW